MITYIKEDVTNVRYGIVAHGCNCQGVMGSGVALAIRNKWPEAYQQYKKVCNAYKDNKDLLGLAHFVTVEKGVAEFDVEYYVIVGNLFTQLNYGKDGKKYADAGAIAIAMEQVYMMAETHKLPIYIPRIGCGLGGLSWDKDVEPIIKELDNLYKNTYNNEIEIFVCDL